MTPITRTSTDYATRGRILASFVLASLLISCAPAAQPGGNAPAASSTQAQSTAPKKVVAAMMGNPPTPIEKAIGGGSGGRIPGITGLEQLVMAGLTIKDDKGALRAQLAEAVPTIENGLWKLLPDGRMETTWIIREGARWHDGAPFTSADLVFGSIVEQDKELPFARDVAYNVIEKIEAPEPRKVVVTWKQAYIDADIFFLTPTLPKHLLERAYLEQKETFSALPYWNVEFVGNGPFRVKEWTRDSHTILEASDHWIGAKPKIREIEVRFIPDENAFVANILSEAVDVTLGKSITLEQTLQLKEKWKNGRIELTPETAMKIWPQFINANPAIMTDVRFRRAMFHGINRQEMVDTFMGGQTTLAHVVLLPKEPELAEVDSALVKYEFDPRKAAQMIEALGYSKGPDGMYRDAAAQRLAVEISATNEDQNTKPMFATADGWQKLGVGVESIVIPIQRQRDREYRATFPAFTLQGGSSGLEAIKSSHGTQARLPENSYTGSNYSRYINPEFDGLIDDYLKAILRVERVEALRRVVNHMTDQLNMMTLYYATSSTMLSNRMRNAGRDPTWNAPEWDIS